MTTEGTAQTTTWNSFLTFWGSNLGGGSRVRIHSCNFSIIQCENFSILCYSSASHELQQPAVELFVNITLRHKIILSPSWTLTSSTTSCIHQLLLTVCIASGKAHQAKYRLCDGYLSWNVPIFHMDDIISLHNWKTELNVDVLMYVWEIECDYVKSNLQKSPLGVIPSKGNSSTHDFNIASAKLWFKFDNTISSFPLIMLRRPFHPSPLTLIHCKFQLRVIITFLPAW